jgi:SNF2 family DNA or RNA helicase
MRAVLRRLARIISTREGVSRSATGSGLCNEPLHFAPSEALLLHTLLEQADRTQEDAAFRDLRQRLESFHTPSSLAPPASFTGTLRDYQQLGLGWFERLRELRMGGCLADEMGLGKTVQVLALLASQHESGARPVSLPCQAAVPAGPSLLVVPRSIVRNWMDEAARFVPQLRVVDVSHQGRKLSDQTFSSCDVAIATYGTLIRDITQLARRAFHYVILDEAQAIKNAAARAAMATKCLQAQHRLVMTGTPIENHLGELWSLMEFLNPALAKHLERFSRNARPEEFALVRQVVRPFLLRRAKRDVARELPGRIEQTLHCDMTELQQAHYDALLERVRADLIGAVKEVGLLRAKLVVISGLLRLRQAACHPVLVDTRRRGAGSGKLEALVPMLEASALEGRKTLVFSQFTSFLALVKKQLDDRGIVYESLDGQTPDRAARVRRFNADDRCTVFLLSLKAGGVGLNLQSAERVILLDPWWNPAVEAQAIDRAHRIGQKRTVHAIRLISAGTIEERVLELQRKKRFLADAIVSGAAGPLESMTRQDLMFLLDAEPLHPDRSTTNAVMLSDATRATGPRSHDPDERRYEQRSAGLSRCGSHASTPRPPARVRQELPAAGCPVRRGHRAQAGSCRDTSARSPRSAGTP